MKLNANRYMKKLSVLLLLVNYFCALSLYSQDTFSIIAIDQSTGEIGAAGATCSDGIAGVGGVQVTNKIVPGKGIATAQAWICTEPNHNLDYAASQIILNRQAEEVLDSLLSYDKCPAKNYDINYRQYGIITIESTGVFHPIAYTGNMASDIKNEITGDNYVIIGNNLTNKAVLDSMKNRFVKQKGTLADKLLAAMHGAKNAGGDARCTERGTSSTSTFLKVAKADDEFNFPSLFINIPGVPRGAEPIDSLQLLYEDFLLSSNNSFDVLNGLNILQSPVKDQLYFNFHSNNFSPFEVVIYNVTGLQVFQQTVNQLESIYNLHLPNLNNGVYLLSVKTNKGFASKKFQVLN